MFSSAFTQQLSSAAPLARIYVFTAFRHVDTACPFVYGGFPTINSRETQNLHRAKICARSEVKQRKVESKFARSIDHLVIISITTREREEEENANNQFECK